MIIEPVSLNDISVLLKSVRHRLFLFSVDGKCGYFKANLVWIQIDLTSRFNRAHIHCTPVLARVSSLITDLVLVLAWRLSGRHKSFSRIDFLFASPQLFHSIDKAVLLPMALSDHKGVFCAATLDCLSQRAVRWCFYASLLKNESHITQFIAEFKCATPYYSAITCVKLQH